jgi:hypothetical protein
MATILTPASCSSPVYTRANRAAHHFQCGSNNLDIELPGALEEKDSHASEDDEFRIKQTVTCGEMVEVVRSDVQVEYAPVG